MPLIKSHASPSNTCTNTKETTWSAYYDASQYYANLEIIFIFDNPLVFLPPRSCRNFSDLGKYLDLNGQRLILASLRFVMGAVYSTYGRELQVVETELAAAKRSAEIVQAQLIAERKAARESAEAEEAHFKAQLGFTRQSVARADTEIAESKKRFQELAKEHETLRIEHQEFQDALSRIQDAHARESAALKDTCQSLQEALEDKRELQDHQRQALEERKVMIQDLSKELLVARTELGDALRGCIKLRDEQILALNAHEKPLMEREEKAKEMVETIRMLRGLVEEQKETIEELQRKTKPYWIFDERRY